jgi:adenosine kinase
MIPGALALFVNEYEYALIKKTTGAQPEELLASRRSTAPAFMVVTHGEKGATIYATGEEVHVPVVPPERIVDPTGVGDAFRGGFLAGFSHGLDWMTCGRMGALTATYCLEQRGPQGHSFSPEEFVARYGQNFDDQDRLSFLLQAD